MTDKTMGRDEAVRVLAAKMRAKAALHGKASQSEYDHEAGAADALDFCADELEAIAALRDGEAVAWSDKERAAIAEMMEAQGLSESALLRCALRQYQSDWLRRQAGETCTWSGDEQRAREFAGICYAPPTPQQPETNDWKEAVLDELAISCMDFPDGTPPRGIIKAVIAWHVQVATDPAVSDAQQPEAQAVAGAVWLMPVATDPPGNSRLLQYAWGRSDLSTGQMAHAYQCIVSAAQECGQILGRRPECANGCPPMTVCDTCQGTHPTTPAVGVEDWKARALAAEADIERMTDAFNRENGPTFMGEPVLPPEKMVELDSGVMVPTWLLDQARRIELYMKSKLPGPWRIGGVQSHDYASTPPAEPSSEGVTDEMVERIGNAHGFRSYTCDASGRNVQHTAWRFTRDELKAALEAALATKPAKE